MKVNYARLNGFAIEAKMLGTSPLVQEPEYKRFRQALKDAWEIRTGEFLQFCRMFFGGEWVIKYHPSLDYHHGIDAVMVSNDTYVTIDVSVRKKSSFKAMVNIAYEDGYSVWKALLSAQMHKQKGNLLKDHIL